MVMYDKMAPYLTLLLAFSLNAVPGVEPAIAVRKFVYQKDISEQCRRRVVPSVFLASHAVDAHSQILHFSQLEVPYSCFISIRTESGSNIILVIQLAADDSLNKSCSENSNQLLVYEMGETFGGYWGPLPDAALENSPPQTKYYTLKTTSSTASYTETEESEIETTTKATTHKSSKSTSQRDYVEVEIPLVNISAALVPGDSDTRPEKSFDIDETFDLIYDVTRRPDVTYRSTMLPMVQFSLKQQYSGARSGNSSDDDEHQQYQLDYNFGDFTQDVRLNFPYYMGNMTTKRMKKYRYNANSRLKFNKHHGHLFSAKDAPFYIEKQSITNSTFDTEEFSSATKFTSTVISVREEITNSWHYVEDLMKEIKKNKSLEPDRDGEYGKENRNVSSTQQKKSEAEHNSSIYSSPGISVHKKHVIIYNNTMKLDVGTRRIMNSSTIMPHLSTKNDSSVVTKYTQKESKNKTVSPLPKRLTTTTMAQIESGATSCSPALPREKNIYKDIPEAKVRLLEVNNMELTTPFNESAVENYNSTVTEISILSMVDRESWENVVQAAPVMAGILNRTTPALQVQQFEYEQQTNSSEPVHHSVVRKKRYIQSISVKEAMPHAMTTQQDVVTTSESIYRFSDIQDFAQLVELQDDETYGRVALRYLGKYVGNTLFNICDVSESPSKARHVFLLNSSRIVISVNRFTMKRMTLVATTARTLMYSDARCNTNQIECQLSGARVCIDSMTACDGVPNCGAYDIYDEDRLRCGAFKGLQHNVYLSAFTFVAVLLTMLYMIHYWLKRCVPKVSDAFFIYTDGSENTLYLDSVMRSPTDVDESGSKMVYHTHLFEDDINSNDLVNTEKRNTICRFIQLLTSCFFRKKRRKRAGEKVEIMDFKNVTQMAEPKKIYSFTELELSKMATFTRNASVQTGGSLEIEFSKEIKKKQVNKINSNIQESSIVVMKDNSTGEEFSRINSKYDGELNMLKFLRDARTGSGQWASKNKFGARVTHDVAIGNERELQNTLYDSRSELPIGQISDMPVTSSADVTLEKPGTSGYNKKRLRFDEVLTMITNEGEEDKTERNRPSVFLGTGKTFNQETLDIIEEDQEHSSGRDFMRFWGGTKSKKSKKKTHLQLR